jgi:ATP-dependent Clp protease ATP-binding subunit ClpA
MKKGLRWQPVLASEHIKRVRKALDESQSTFAKRLGVDTVTVARWETGQRKCAGEYATAIARLDRSGDPLVNDFLEKTSELSNFTDRAVKSILLSQAETHRQGRHYIGTEQILLGLIGEGLGTAAICLRAMGVRFKLAEIYVELRDGTGPYAIFKEKALSPRTRAMLELPRAQTRFHAINFGIEYSGRSQKLIESASDEALIRGHESVGTGHLLLALLSLGEKIPPPARLGECGGIEILDSMGIDRTQLKLEIDLRLKTSEGALDTLPRISVPANESDSAFTKPLAAMLHELREAIEMLFLMQKYDLAMWLRDREVELWKKISTDIPGFPDLDLV